MIKNKYYGKRATIFINENVARRNIVNIEEEIGEFCAKNLIAYINTVKYEDNGFTSTYEVLQKIMNEYYDKAIDTILVYNFKHIADNKEELVAMQQILTDYDIEIISISQGLIGKEKNYV